MMTSRMLPAVERGVANDGNTDGTSSNSARHLPLVTISLTCNVLILYVSRIDSFYLFSRSQLNLAGEHVVQEQDVPM